jgi:microcystin synthetase protein McyA
MLEQLKLMLERMPLCFDLRVAGLLATQQSADGPKLTLAGSGDVDRAEADALVMASRADLRDKQEILARIWAQVLGVDEASPEDDFYALGGDSILSMQVCARAAGFGLKLTPGQILRERTLKNVAALATREFEFSAEAAPIIGQLPLTPIQHWFFELGLDEPDAYNQSVLFRANHALNPEAVLRASRLIMNHHDALRLRFKLGPSGIVQTNDGPSSDTPFIEIDLHELQRVTIMETIGALADNVFHSISLSGGPLVRIVLFTHGAQSEQWLLFVIHHLAIDGVSWRILLEDFWTAYDFAESGRPVALGRRTTSFKKWADLLAEYAVSDRAKSQKEYWLLQTGAAVPRLPVDTPKGFLRKELPRTVAFELEPEHTRALLTLIRDGVQAALLTALVETLVPWIGVRCILVDIEGHGRQALFSDVDLSHTVGWFTATYPLLVSTDGAAGWAGRTHLVAEQLGRVPDGGIGYGALRYLSGILTAPSTGVNHSSIDGPHTGANASSEPNERSEGNRRFMPEVSLNYLGQFDQSLRTVEKHASPADWAGPRLSSAKLAHLIEVNAMVTGGSLVVTILFDQSLYHTETVEALGERFLASLREIVTEAGSPMQRPSPSDPANQSTVEE